MADDKTEVEFAGVKFKGGKIFVLITALTTLSGGLYAGFEFYKDYMNMRTKIEKYTAPDLSGIRKELADYKFTFRYFSKVARAIVLKNCISKTPIFFKRPASRVNNIQVTIPIMIN